MLVAIPIVLGPERMPRAVSSDTHTPQPLLRVQPNTAADHDKADVGHHRITVV